MLAEWKENKFFLQLKEHSKERLNNESNKKIVVKREESKSIKG